MSSRFVSGGTIGPTGDISNDAGDTEGAKQSPPEAPGPVSKNEEWEAVQKELEAERKRREEARLKAATGEEKTLYDILQANKAAKQAAFEEKTKIRNQFRALDDDEVHFLDEVRARKKQAEDEVREETEEGLKAFRAQQRKELAAGEAGADPVVAQTQLAADHWAAGGRRKRKAGGERGGRAVRRKSAGREGGEETACEDEGGKGTEKRETTRMGSALVGYGSDSSDEDE